MKMENIGHFHINMPKISILLIFILSLLFYPQHAIGENKIMDFNIKEFANQGKIPSDLTCDGADRIPTLNWANAPKETVSFALIMDDPDAPAGTWDHWIVFNIPKHIGELSHKQPLPAGSLNGKNSWGTLNYGGPCPPDREHRYFFTLYALDTTLNLPQGSSKASILAKIAGHVLEKVSVIGLYERIKK